MKTLQIVNVRWFNATAWYGVQIAYGLQQLGHESAVVCLKDTDPAKVAKKLGLKVFEIPLNSSNPYTIFKNAHAIDKLCKEFQPDIVNCHRGESFFLWALKRKKWKYNLVRTRGDQRLPKNSWLNRLLYRDCAQAIVSTNMHMTKHFTTAMEIPSEHIFTILGGVDTKKFHPMPELKEQIRSRFGFSNDHFLIGICGRLDPVKGHKQAFEAFRKYLDTNTEKLQDKEIKLLIIGQDTISTASELRTWANELGLSEERVHLLGFVPDMTEAMNMLDLGLIASVSSETIARVAFEMIACDIPIIGTDVGVMPDILPKEYLYSPYDTDRLAFFMQKALEDNFTTDVLKICQERFHNKAENSIYGWSLDSFIHKTLKLYEKISKNKGVFLN